MPCEACREFFMELSAGNRNMEILMDYTKRQTVTLGELMPYWRGEARTVGPRD